MRRCRRCGGTAQTAAQKIKIKISSLIEMEAGEFPSTIKNKPERGAVVQGEEEKKIIIIIMFFLARAGPSRDKPINRSVD